MDDYSDFLDFPFYGEAFEERGSTLLVVKDHNRKSFFMCGEDNWDCFAGRNLVDISLEAGFVYERIIQLLVTDGFLPITVIPEDTQYIITTHCHEKKFECYDTQRKVDLDPCQMMTHQELENSGVGPTLYEVIESNHFADNSKLTDEEWVEYYRQREKEKKWWPVYPIDLKNPKVLTPLQVERGTQLFKKLEEFIEMQDENNDCAPEICITQNWKISVDFGGWRNDSDIIRSALCVMCQDEETGQFYLDKDYLMQCIPYLEDELADYAEEEDEEKGLTKRDGRFDIEYNFSNAVRSYLDKNCPENTLITLDTSTNSCHLSTYVSEFDNENIKLFQPENFIERRLGWKPRPDHHKIAELAKILIP